METREKWKFSSVENFNTAVCALECSSCWVYFDYFFHLPATFSPFSLPNAAEPKRLHTPGLEGAKASVFPNLSHSVCLCHLQFVTFAPLQTMLATHRLIRHSYSYFSAAVKMTPYANKTVLKALHVHEMTSGHISPQYPESDDTIIAPRISRSIAHLLPSTHIPF